MLCPYCGKDKDHVVDSRSMAEGTAIRRRRECLACGRRFTTYEHVDEISLMIVKRDGRREAFSRDKIATGIRHACQKRPISEDQIQEMTGAAEKRIFSQSEKEVESTIVGEMVMKSLREVDQVAYVRFASVYRSFKDVNEFMNELSQFLVQPAPKSRRKSAKAAPRKEKKSAKTKGKEK
jgi:transcriptional repressor NrdR